MKSNLEIAEEGRQAARENKPMFENPYTPNVCPYPSHFMSWLAGWCEVEREKNRDELKTA